VHAVRSQLADAQRAKCRGTVMGSCTSERTAISRDETALGEAEDALVIDRLRAGSSVRSAKQTLAGDEATLSAAKSALAGDEAQATNPNSTFTSLPAPGRLITRGEAVFSLNDHPVPLLYGTATLYRDLAPGVGDGRDVLELERNLVALGFQHGPASRHLSAATESGIRAWQRSLDLPVTGVMRLGDAVVEPGAIRIATVTAKPGSAKSAGETVLSATSTRRAVTVNLDASQQSDVKVGDRVTVTLPDNTTTPGVVSSVGTVVSSSTAAGSSGSGGSSAATIRVEVRLTDPRAAGALDAAPVTVSITNASVRDALVVPVDALLALSSGGYALEVAEAYGAHRLLGVATGLFDDADGLVQVSGTGLSAGQKIVVPT
jgi:peptidoglycan hydrolase-like protein with peptidoglycan-binding domain